MGVIFYRRGFNKLKITDFLMCDICSKFVYKGEFFQHSKSCSSNTLINVDSQNSAAIRFHILLFVCGFEQHFNHNINLYIYEDFLQTADRFVHRVKRKLDVSNLLKEFTRNEIYCIHRIFHSLINYGD